jgi:hypothetical protein
MTNILTKLRKAVAPINTTGRALGIFGKALAALDEVRENQTKRIWRNQDERVHNVDIINGLLEKNEHLVDDTANAVLEVEAADKAEAAIRALITA